jgi:hypothetical protein
MAKFKDKILEECVEFFPNLTWDLSFQDDSTLYFGITKPEDYQLCVGVTPLINKRIKVNIILWGKEKNNLFQVTEELKGTRLEYPDSIKHILSANQNNINHLLPELQ